MGFFFSVVLLLPRELTYSAKLVSTARIENIFEGCKGCCGLYIYTKKIKKIASSNTSCTRNKEHLKSVAGCRILMEIIIICLCFCIVSVNLFWYFEKFANLLNLSAGNRKAVFNKAHGGDIATSEFGIQ